MEGQWQDLRIYKSRESEEYAALAAAFVDLSFSAECLKRLKTLSEKPDPDKVVFEALWDAATVGFFRCFDSPNGLSRSVLQELPQGAEQAFTFFKNYRDKHIAHRSNSMDQVKIGLALAAHSDDDNPVDGVGYVCMQDASFADRSWILSLSRLIDALLVVLSQKMSRASDAVLAKARSEPIDKLYKLPPLLMVVPEANYLNKTSKQTK